ncbi:peptidylprolyl isomerase [Polaribacter sp. ALD11]|uniref:FKBP-type peptidyl-prolyl cis-trans isomerase n=1 Tax=Polaribacter sp. ALD11 TaxID=2058137 RepID=UPI000C30A807|nr:FKBP-type peptidyl-prolyl cis-trans isomerase [Polaribacter sp. ALD11]AUC84354.1 peptidylprolyl isomerase [Polaribacter sp. ALD11]
MNKIKNIFLLLLLGIGVIYSCDDDNNGFVNPFANINYEELAISDNDSIVKFLKNNYYDVSLDSVKTLVSGKTSLFDDTDNLKSMKIIDNDIEHTLYVYTRKEGMPNPVKENPTVMDSVYVKYSGQALMNTELLTSNFDKNDTGVWFTLNAVIKGWTYGFTRMKGGELEKEANGDPINGPINYLNTGKGILFIPSGLAYPSSNTNNFNSNLVNTNLMFYIELLDLVEDTDHDNDGTASIDEDADGDGDPTNDFSDKRNPGLPDYLNPSIK